MTLAISSLSTSIAVDVSTKAMFENTPLPDRADEDATEPARAVASLSSEGAVVPRRLNDGVVRGSIAVIGVPMRDVDLLGDEGGEKLNRRSRSRVQSWVVR
jgi:hypothetical protein